MTTNLSRSSSATSKRKADDDGPTVKKKIIRRKPTTGLKINSGPTPLIRSSSQLGQSTSRPPSALAQHPRTSHTPPTSDGEPSRRPMRQAPPSPPVPAIIAARARGDSLPPVDPTPVRAPSRIGSVSRTTSAPVNKGKSKSRLPGLGIPVVIEEEEAQDRWMAGQRSELDERERDNERRAGTSRISTLNFASSATGSTPLRKRPADNSASSSSALSRAVLDSTQPVPISDTPVIVRNREIRQASQSRRRSSLSSRGKRASQSLSSGLLATPHASVPPDTFYRHVDADLPDSLRFRQVLSWTASRASDKQPPNKPSPIVQDYLKSIQTQAIKRLASGQIDTSISPSRTSDSNKPLPPHPKNVTNAQAISKLEAYNQACQAEDNAWSELIAAYNSQQAQVVAALATTAEKEPKEIELDDPWRQGMQLVKEVLHTVKEGVGDGAEADDEMSDGEQEIVNQINSLEPQVYEAYESAYRAQQFNAKAFVHLDHVFETLSGTLRQRTAPQSALVPKDETGRMLGVASGAGVDTMDLLRALAGSSGSSGGGTRAKTNGIPPKALNEALQKVTPVTSAPTPRKPPGTPRASRGGVGRTKKR